MNEDIFIIFVGNRIVKVPEMILQIIKINNKMQFDELYSLLIANETKNKLQKFITRFSKEKGLECQQDFNSFIISLVEYKKKSADFKIIATTNRIYKILKLDKISLFDDVPKIINEKLLGWRFKNNKSAIESLKIVLELGADVNIKNSLGEPPLHRAKNFANIKILIAYGADVNANGNAIKLLLENCFNFKDKYW